MSTLLTLATSWHDDGRPVLAVTGEIDMSNAGTLEAALNRAVGAAGPSLIVDLSAVDYIDSAGLTVLFAHATRIELVAGPVIAPVLSISGLAELTTVHGLEPGPPGAGSRG